jgi:lipopolysaccharide biosynthesis protein
VATRGDAPGESVDTGVTSIAFYLPQFRPIPENDEWWGAGFTEWTSVARARPLYPGHYQPRLPGELGFYDLRVAETRIEQAALAREHGIDAFCFWHYWFSGRRMLEQLEQEWLDTGEPDLGFMVAWANAPWGGIWSNVEPEWWITQEYPGADDDRRHVEALLPLFHDRRYLRIDGRPAFYVFWPEDVPELEAWVERWRELAVAGGLPGIFLIAEKKRSTPHRVLDAGFDAYVSWDLLPEQRRTWPASKARRVASAGWWNKRLQPHLEGRVPKVFRYDTMAPLWPDLVEDRLSFPSVMPGWDNTARRGRRGIVLHDARPAAWAAQVERALTLLDGRPRGERVLFVKSWNEWAEGNYLEPDRRFGRAFLEAYRDALAAHRWP